MLSEIDNDIETKILNDSDFALSIYEIMCDENKRLKEELKKHTEKVYIKDNQEGNQFMTVSNCPEGYRGNYNDEPYGNLVELRTTNADTNDGINMYLSNREALKLAKEILKNI